MRALVRLAGVALCGVVLYYAGQAHGIVQDAPQPFGAVLVVALLAMSLVLLVWLASGTGRGDAAVAGSRDRRRILRALWLAVAAFALLGVLMLASVADRPSADWTPYHNDAIALNECSARLLLQGENPYAALDIFACYDALGIGPDRTTPLRRGLFRDVELYPSEDALQSVWALRRAAPRENVEFEWRPSYPALSFLALMPWVLARLDPNLLSTALLVLAAALVVARTAPSLRGLMVTGLLANLVVIAYTMGGSSDLVWAAPLVVAWLWRERRWSALVLGLAFAAKQLAWFVAPYYALTVVAAFGWREALRRVALAVGVFTAINVPFILADPGAWLAGVLTPVAEPMFPLGAGLVFLATTQTTPLLPTWTYQVTEGIAFVACLAIAWRSRRTSPEVGIVLAYVPLFFAWRSLFSYFYLLPLFAAAAIAHMPLGALEATRAQRLGAVALAILGPRPLPTPRRPAVEVPLSPRARPSLAPGSRALLADPRDEREHG